MGLSAHKHGLLLTRSRSPDMEAVWVVWASMSLAWHHAGDTIIWSAALLSAVSALGAVGWRFAGRPLVGFFVEQADMIHAVRTHLIDNNGGTSLPDRLDRIDSRLTTIEEYVTNPKGR